MYNTVFKSKSSIQIKLENQLHSMPEKSLDDVPDPANTPGSKKQRRRHPKPKIDEKESLRTHRIFITVWRGFYLGILSKRFAVRIINMITGRGLQSVRYLRYLRRNQFQNTNSFLLPKQIKRGRLERYKKRHEAGKNVPDS